MFEKNREDERFEDLQSGVIRNYESMEAHVNQGLRVALNAPTPDGSIEIILEYLGRFLNGERTYIFEKNETGGDDNTYEWVADGVVPVKDLLQDLPGEVCAHWYDSFSENRHIVIRDLEDIRESDPLQYENLKRQDIHSLVVVPLYDEGRVIAFYGVDNPGHDLSFEYTADMLQIMGHFLVSSIKRRNLVRQLQEMSYHDQLTKLGNRFAYEEYVGKLDPAKSIGVMYADITGLKKVNDEQGHRAGDRLIRNAAASLTDTFPKETLFRIGGDELIAVCPDVSEEEFDRQVELLRENAGKHEVALAIGASWQERTPDDLDHLLTEAERRMYDDKSAYYQKMGLERRKR